MADEDLDIIILQELDFGHEPPCERNISGKVDDCPNSAAWIVRMMCCGTTNLFCDNHLIAVKMMFENPTVNMVCNSEAGGCGAESINIKVQPLG